MTALFIILLAVLLFILYMIKASSDLEKYKDNVLKGLAGVDALLIKKNAILLDIIGYAKEFMEKEQYLVAEIISIRQEITKIKPKIENAEQRYMLQIKLDKQLELLIAAMEKYKDLKNNAGLQSVLKNLAAHEQALDEKLKFYNDSVDKLNNAIINFPSSIIANINKVKAPPPRYDRF